MQAILEKIKKLRYLFYIFLSLIISLNILNASGGYDNGTSIGKGNLGVDLTWNPFNYWPKGQSYIVLSYGITENLNIHGYYSSPAKGTDNYYSGFFYQFIRNKFLDLSTAIGVRKYISSPRTHLFAPQLLYSIHTAYNFTIGGSFVTIRDVNKNFNIEGSTIDISLILPMLSKNKVSFGIYSIDFVLGVFKPVLWKPNNGLWHPTYGFDFKINL